MLVHYKTLSCGLYIMIIELFIHNVSINLPYLHELCHLHHNIHLPLTILREKINLLQPTLSLIREINNVKSIYWIHVVLTTVQQFVELT